MANVLTKHFSKITGKNVTNADILNSIREKAGSDYQKEIDKLGHLTQINHANIPYTIYEIHENEFLGILINKIGSSVYKTLQYDMPFSVFMSEMFDAGETLEEVWVDPPTEQTYNAKDTTSPFMHADTDIKVFYHDINRESLYERTINKAWSIKAFQSEHAFDEFINKIFTSMLSKDQLDIFERIKNLVPLSLTPVNIAPAGSPPVYINSPHQQFDRSQDDFIVDFNKELIKRSNLFTVPSSTRFENGAGVSNSTPIDDQYLIVTAEFSAELDSLLANAFNMDKATVLAHKIVVDEFPPYAGAGDLNGAKPFAALVSKNTIILKDKFIQMQNIFNPRTLNYNYFLHHHQMISYSLLENSRVYYEMPVAEETP